MRSSAWLRLLRPPRRRIRSDKYRELLRSQDRIDIELGHPLDPHLVTKSRVEHDCHRVIGDCRAISVVCIRLFPNSAIFEPDLGVTLQAVDVAIDTTNK